MSIINLDETKQYASVRNILHYKFAEDWAKVGIVHSSALHESFLLAKACEMLGDYEFARILLEMLQEKEYFPDVISKELINLGIREKQIKYVDVTCMHESVKEALVRLVKVFNQLKRNITAIVVENEDEYISIWRSHGDIL